MKEEATRVGADWDVVMRADASPRESRDWQNLLLLVRRAISKVEQQLFWISADLDLAVGEPWPACALRPIGAARSPP